MASPKIIMGNWKMNGLLADGLDRSAGLKDAVAKDPASAHYKMVLCPPATLTLSVINLVKGSALAVGGQDCHAEKSGAFTGNISAEMLQNLGAAYVIVGHSERRQYHKETSEDVAAKAKAAHAAGLIAVICVGETDAERTSGQAESIVLDQLKKSIPDGATAENTIVAYEPVWAIGTGKSASAADIENMHATIRGQVNSIKILYGGSVKASTAKEVLHTKNVDGVLVGGASLKVDEFMAIASASQADAG